MVYKVIGIMSGSSLDGLDIALVHLRETAGNWAYEIKAAACYPYSDELTSRLREAIYLDALQYQLLHVAFGHYIGREVNKFIEQNDLPHQVDLIVSHGHTTFHLPAELMTAQLGEGASIAAETALPVVTELRALDVALGGQGAPIVPIGEELLFPEFDLFLNLGGIANVTIKNHAETGGPAMIAFDVCAANRVLNMLASDAGLTYDEDGTLAASGNVQPELLQKLEALGYYKLPYPKSLNNNFGTDIIYPLVKSGVLNIEDGLCTYVTHIALQVKRIFEQTNRPVAGRKLLVTGGGAFNKFLLHTLQQHLHSIGIEAVVPDAGTVKYKEAVVMALIGTLRWREEYTVFNSVTGAKRRSIGGALWLGNDA